MCFDLFDFALCVRCLLSRNRFLLGRLSKCGHLEDMTSPVASPILSL